MTTCKNAADLWDMWECESWPDFPCGVPWRYSALRNAAIVACIPFDHFGTVANLDNGWEPSYYGESCPEPDDSIFDTCELCGNTGKLKYNGTKSAWACNSGCP